MSGLKLNVQEAAGGVICIDLEGFLDAHNFRKLESLFAEQFKQSRYRFLLDLSRLEYVSSAGAGVFIGAAATCQDHHGRIVLLRPTAEVEEILELLGVYQIFQVEKDRERALTRF